MPSDAHKTSDEVISTPRCWVVAPDRPGTLNQALGLAQAMARHIDLRIEIRTVEIQPFWQRVPIALWPDPFRLLVGKTAPPHASEKQPLTREDGLNILPNAGSNIEPNIWIATGRQSVPFTIAAKRRNPNLWTVQTQDPKAPLSYFDAVVPPSHDGVTGENTISMIGAPTTLTPEGIEEAAQTLGKGFSLPGKKTIAVLIGGPNKHLKMSEAATQRLISQLKSLIEKEFTLLITTSRRTPDTMITALKTLETTPNVILHIAQGTDMHPNPYPGILGVADAVLVTQDSVNMITEASLTGKPVYSLSLDGSAGKFSTLHQSLQEAGILRPFAGHIEEWTYHPFHETDRVAQEILKRWKARDWQPPL